MLLLIAAVAVVWLCVVPYTFLFAAETGIQMSPASIRRNPDLLITAAELLEKISQNNNILLVDVRIPEEFERARMPNSLNIPLHQLKSKPFLKNLDFVLINSGGNYYTLEEEAVRLKGLGFDKVKVLAGGMSAWQDSGERVDGDPDIISRLNEISPRDFSLDLVYDDWVLINTSTVKPIAKDPVFSGAAHIPLKDKREEFVKKVRSALAAKSGIPLPFILIFNDNGEYGHIKYALRDAGLTNVFYLKGGTAAYRDFLQNQKLMLDPGRKTSTQCATCPQ